MGRLVTTLLLAFLSTISGVAWGKTSPAQWYLVIFDVPRFTHNICMVSLSSGVPTPNTLTAKLVKQLEDTGLLASVALGPQTAHVSVGIFTTEETAKKIRVFEGIYSVQSSSF